MICSLSVGDGRAGAQPPQMGLKSMLNNNDRNVGMHNYVLGQIQKNSTRSWTAKHVFHIFSLNVAVWGRINMAAFSKMMNIEQQI